MKMTWILVVALGVGLGASSANAQKMYLAAFQGIIRANLDGSDVEVIVAGSTGARGIALDVDAGMMYWTVVSGDKNQRKIQRTNMEIPQGETSDNRTDIEDLVTPVNVSMIAVDPAGGKMYWTTFGSAKIQRANLDGSGVEDLVTTGLLNPGSIALDVTDTKMYWTDIGTGKIQRANMDGSIVDDLVVTTGDDAPYSLALDVGVGKMYWMSAGADFQLFPKIKRANLDGSGIEILVDLDLAGFGIGMALDLGEGKIYWTTEVERAIRRANLDGSGVETVLDNGPSGLKGIALDLRAAPIPTVSEWGMIAMTVFLLAIGTIIIRRRRTSHNHCAHSGRFGGQPL